MPRRFQFSLKTMLASTALSAVGIACLAFKDQSDLVASISGYTAVGAGIGLPFRLAHILAPVGFAAGIAAFFVLDFRF